MGIEFNLRIFYDIMLKTNEKSMQLTFSYP